MFFQSSGKDVSFLFFYRFSEKCISKEAGCNADRLCAEGENEIQERGKYGNDIETSREEHRYWLPGTGDNALEYPVPGKAGRGGRNRRRLGTCGSTRGNLCNLWLCLPHRQDVQCRLVDRWEQRT